MALDAAVLAAGPGTLAEARRISYHALTENMLRGLRSLFSGHLQYYVGHAGNTIRTGSKSTYSCRDGAPVSVSPGTIRLYVAAGLAVEGRGKGHYRQTHGSWDSSGVTRLLPTALAARVVLDTPMLSAMHEIREQAEELVAAFEDSVPKSELADTPWVSRDGYTDMVSPELSREHDGTRLERDLANAYVSLLRPLMHLLGVAWADGTESRCSTGPLFPTPPSGVVPGRAIAVPGWMPDAAYRVSDIIRTARAVGYAEGVGKGTRMLQRLADGTLTVDEMSATVKAAKGERK